MVLTMEGHTVSAFCLYVDDKSGLCLRYHGDDICDIMWYHGDILVIIFVILWSSYVWYWAMSGNASWQLPGSRLSLLCHCALLQHYHHHHHHHQKWKLRYQQASAELSISYLSQRRGSLNQSGLGYDLFHSKHLDVSWLFTFTYAVTKLSETANKLSPRCQHPSNININVFSTRYFGLPATHWISKLSVYHTLHIFLFLELRHYYSIHT